MVTRLVFFLFLVLSSPLHAQNQCRQALALGLDVSGSVDAQEYRLQIDGLAAALMSPVVRSQLLLNPEVPIWVAGFEWAAVDYQRLFLDWTPLRSEADIAKVARVLRAQQRGTKTTSTAIGSAMLFAETLFRQMPGCWRRTLDISGDGKNNDGNLPQIVKRRAGFRDVTINGLVIGPATDMGDDERRMEVMDLSAYFRRRVIHGPGAFIEIASGFQDYERAMTKKLLRETKGLAIGGLSPAPADSVFASAAITLPKEPPRYDAPR